MYQQHLQQQQQQYLAMQQQQMQSFYNQQAAMYGMPASSGATDTTASYGSGGNMQSVSY